MDTDISHQIIDFINQHPGNSSSQVHKALGNVISYATVKRTLTKLQNKGYIISSGKMRSTTYSISPSYALLHRINIEEYFQKEIDERRIQAQFNFSLIRELLPSVSLLTASENEKLNALHQQFLKNIDRTSPEIYAKEMERLAIDLSWKSSQIEGNTYSLLETERLLTEKVTAAGKPKDDAIMLLNHKEAINFIAEHKDYTSPLTLRAIEDIHSILIKDLNVDRNIRTGRVGITGTNYSPLDNEYQIKEAMQDMCTLINNKENIFERALLALLLISYIQPFADGNKRTSRIISNAQLLSNGYCPLSFRTVDAIDYKKAMLIFYEQNNASAFKKIFIEQYEFAVKTYF